MRARAILHRAARGRTRPRVVLQESTDLEWTDLAPAALIGPGERTGEYGTAESELVTDDGGDSYISTEDFTVALVDELEAGDAVHTYLGTGY